MRPDARQILRSETRLLHDRLDAQISAYDIATAAGYGTYLDMTLVAMDAVLSASCPDETWSDALRTARDQARSDHAKLRRPKPVVSLGAPDRIGLGTFYVISGARLGARVLSRRVATHGTPEVIAAQRFFDRQPLDRLWPELLRQLEALPSAALPAITEEACATFRLYLDALDAVASGAYAAE